MDSFKDKNQELFTEKKAVKKMVIRKGKKIKKYVCPEKGFDLNKPGGKKCVKVSASKQMKKEKQALKTAKKSKSKKAIAAMKRKRSLKKRKGIHAKFKKEGFLTWGEFISEADRDYKKEYEKYHSNKEQRANRSKRVLARRQLEKEGRVCKGDGKDVDHKDGNPQNNDRKNLRVLPANKNRGRDNNKWRK
jgi:hypothetical protein|tara:strand:+ start:227 stop:796 length:570 start_codon:yes stop_codon:yes gene_type:complete